MSEPTETPPFATFKWILRLLDQWRRRPILVVASFLAIMLAVVGLVTVTAATNSFRKELIGKLLDINGDLRVLPLDSPLSDFDQVAARLSTVQGVILAVPIVEGQALASSPFNARSVLVRGIRRADLAQLGSIAGSIKQGDLAGFEDGPGMIVGRRLAAQLSLWVGDNIRLAAPRSAPGTTPHIRSYKLAAVFESGLPEYDSAVVYMPLGESQAYFERVGTVSAIDVYIENADEADRFHKVLADAAQRPISIVDWRRRNATFFAARQRALRS
jgi:lipoprotein-releasing system permease protein